MRTHTQPAASTIKRLLASLMVAVLFVYPLTLEAETPAVHPIQLDNSAPIFAAAAAPAPQGLQIEILDGEGALNNIRQRTAREPIVEVKDENHKPVAGALILFTVHPGEGALGPILGPSASATFHGSASISMYTDASGRAVGSGLEPNHHTGDYTIEVTAMVGSVVASAVIHQRNVRGAATPSSNTTGTAQGTGNGSSKHIGHARLIKWTLVGAVAVVTVVLVYVLTRGHASTTVTAGTGTVAGP